MKQLRAEFADTRSITIKVNGKPEVEVRLAASDLFIDFYVPGAPVPFATRGIR